MDKADVLCSLEVEPRTELPELAAMMRGAIGLEGRVVESESAAFAGTGIGELILVLGSSGAIAAAAKVLVAWLTARKDRVIKINKTELKGYSVEDAVRLIKVLPGDQRSANIKSGRRTKHG